MLGVSPNKLLLIGVFGGLVSTLEQVGNPLFASDPASQVLKNPLFPGGLSYGSPEIRTQDQPVKRGLIFAQNPVHH